MRDDVDRLLTKGRIRTGYLASPDEWRLTGAFFVDCPETGRKLAIIASGDHPTDWADAGMPGDSWEHVSVSLQDRSKCPSWPEMDFVKDLFWRPDEVVIQFHPPDGERINYHPGCLHLWKPPYPVQLPPSITVGPKDARP